MLELSFGLYTLFLIKGEFQFGETLFICQEATTNGSELPTDGLSQLLCKSTSLLFQLRQKQKNRQPDEMKKHSLAPPGIEPTVLLILIPSSDPAVSSLSELKEKRSWIGMIPTRASLQGALFSSSSTVWTVDVFHCPEKITQKIGFRVYMRLLKAYPNQGRVWGGGTLYTS